MIKIILKIVNFFVDFLTHSMAKKNINAIKSQYMLFYSFSVIDSKNKIVYTAGNELVQNEIMITQYFNIIGYIDAIKIITAHSAYILFSVMYLSKGTYHYLSSIKVDNINLDLSLFAPSIMLYSFIYMSNILFSFIKRNLEARYSFPNFITSLILVMNGVYTLRKVYLVEGISKLSEEELSYINSNNLKIEENNNKYYYRKINNDIQIRKHIINILENCAKYTEYYIPRYFKTKDNATNEWFKKSMSQIACAIRDKKKWILNPKEDTYEYFTSYLITTLSLALKDNWDAIERIEIEQEKVSLTIRGAMFDKIRQFFKTLIISAMPAIFFVLFQLTPFAISGSEHDWIMTILFIWVGVTFIVKYDSDVTSKVSLLKETKNLLR